jgi:hypothetical protein
MIRSDHKLGPMSEEQYWQIIAESIKEGPYQSWQEHFLVHKLKTFTVEELVGYELRTELLMHASYTANLWCAADLLNNGCSDDGFDYFRYWLISRGKKVYHDSLQNPDSLVAQIDERKQFYDFEKFGYIAHKVFEQKTDGNLYDYIRDGLPHSREPEIQLTWDSEKPETMRAICPQIFDRMWRPRH